MQVAKAQLFTKGSLPSARNPPFATHFGEWINSGKSGAGQIWRNYKGEEFTFLLWLSGLSWTSYSSIKLRAEIWSRPEEPNQFWCQHWACLKQRMELLLLALLCLHILKTEALGKSFPALSNPTLRFLLFLICFWLSGRAVQPLWFSSMANEGWFIYFLCLLFFCVKIARVGFSHEWMSALGISFHLERFYLPSSSKKNQWA